MLTLEVELAQNFSIVDAGLKLKCRLPKGRRPVKLATNNIETENRTKLHKYKELQLYIYTY